MAVYQESANVSNPSGAVWWPDAATAAGANLTRFMRAHPVDSFEALNERAWVETANLYLFKSNVNPSRDSAPVMGIGRVQMYVVAPPTLEQSTGAFLTHVSYRGSAPALEDVMAGQADFVSVDTAAFRKLLADEGKTLSTLIKDRKIVLE